MKLSELFETEGPDERLRNDGKLKDRLKIIDDNIEMFSAPIYAKDPKIQKRVQELEDGKDLLQKFYSGEISRGVVPFHIWDLTSSIPSWGTYGT